MTAVPSALSKYVRNLNPNAPLVIISELNRVFDNLALERALIDAAKPRKLPNQSNLPYPILYLWRNEPCVVLGRNQNPFSECKVDLVKSDKIDLSRRHTGGGAVYQDLGNSIFTVLHPGRTTEDKAFGNKLVIDALKRHKIAAKVSGRNDLCIDDRKFSGSAFRLSPGMFVHHGTVMRSVQLNKLNKYLTPHPLKFINKKGSDSVRSRVCNLDEIAKKTVSHEAICESMTEAFTEALQKTGTNQRLNTIRIESTDHPLLKDDKLNYKKYLETLVDPKWIYGTTPPFETALFIKSDDGIIELRLKVNRGTIDDIQVFTDSLDESKSERLGNIFKVLKGHKFDELDWKRSAEKLGIAFSS